MESISRMFLTAGCLQYVGYPLQLCWKASEICSSSCVSHFAVCQALQSGIYIEVSDLGKIQRKLREDLFSIAAHCHFQNGYSISSNTSVVETI